MSLQRQLAFWLGGLALLIVILYLLSEILLPFVAGLAVAYFLDPVANRLERLGMSRIAASIVIMGAFLILFVLALVLLLPPITAQFWSFVQRLPEAVQALQGMIPPRFRDAVERAFGTSGRSLGQFVSEGAAWLGTFLASLWSGGQALISIVGLFVVTPVVAFYMLIDWRRMVALVDSWVPPRHRETVNQLAIEMDDAISGFVRGQSTVCLLLGAFYAITLNLLGLNFGLLIGVFSGLLSFIPFVGSITGFVLSTGVALVQFWPDWLMIGAVVAVFALGQFIEGNILQPRLVGRSVGLHPVWLMFALFAFGYLFGFVGALLSVPLAAALGVLTRFALRQYLASPLYTGEPEAPQPVAIEEERRVSRR